jgi:hypothetical protein
MRWLFPLVLAGLAVPAFLSAASAQPRASLGQPNAAPVEASTQIQAPRPEVELQHLQDSTKELRIHQTSLQEAAKQDETLKKQVELLQKQIEIQQKQIILLMENMKKQTSLGAPVEKLEAQVIKLESRSVQAAQRDVELSQAIDKVVEHQDAVERNPILPAGVRELFLPSGTSETTLSIYGALAVGYSSFQGNAATAANGAGRPSVPGGFYFGEFTPDFLLKLNDWILLEAEIGIGGDGSVAAGSFAQADFFINDWLTIIAGRFVAPLGWHNERLNNPWINKLPADAPGSGPLLWQQVLPPMAMMGVQAAGAFYLGNSPIKMEYNAYISNGLNLAPANPTAPTIDELANLENMTNSFNITQSGKAYGGRVGLWYPEHGLAGGVSYMRSSDYVVGFGDSITIFAVDLNYHKDNWDVRLEYGRNYQQATSFGFDNIRREGVHAQVAYRPRHLPPGFLQNVELVYRYGYVNFRGISPTALDLTTYSTPVDVPVRRQQNEIGVNYWFAPRAAIKFAFQINDEPGFHLHDNQWLCELAWGW